MSNTTPDTPAITALRAHLFAQLAELRNTGTADPEALRAVISKASAVAEIAKVITDTAKVEVDYLRATGGGESSFIDTAIGQTNLPAGITGITRHRLAG
jgi:hypothetical protein